MCLVLLLLFAGEGRYVGLRRRAAAACVLLRACLERELPPSVVLHPPCDVPQPHAPPLATPIITRAHTLHLTAAPAHSARLGGDLLAAAPAPEAVAAAPAAAAAAAVDDHTRSPASGRALRSTTLPALALPPITAFLPPVDAVGIASMSNFMTRSGLPTWDELGLPPIAELMKPVGGPKGAQLPSPAEIYAQAGAALDEVVAAQLPKALLPTYKLAKGLGLVRLPGTGANGAVNISAIAVPTIPKGLPTLAALLAALKVPGMNATATVLREAEKLNTTALAAAWEKPIAVPALALPNNLPSFQQVMAAAKLANTLMNAMPLAAAGGKAATTAANVPSFAQVMSIVNQIGKSLKTSGAAAAAG